MCFSNSSTPDTPEPPSKPVSASDKHIWTPSHPVSTRSKPMGNGMSPLRNARRQEFLARIYEAEIAHANAQTIGEFVILC